MRTPAPEQLDLPVEGGALRALRWGTGARTVLAVHGITASAMVWQATARHLPAAWSLVAVDLRGRGASAGLPGPYGLRRHAADVRRVAAHLRAGGDRVTLAGHSLGGYISLLAATGPQDLFDRLVLVDGGVALPLPPEVDVDEALAATLGPALARLERTFATAEEYVAFWQAHPAFTTGWNADTEDYVRYDLTGSEPALRSRVVPAAASADGRDLLLLADDFAAALRGLALPTLLLTAPAGMFGAPPGLLPAEAAAAWADELALLTLESVPDSNHYTILLEPAAAALVARRLHDPRSWPG